MPFVGPMTFIILIILCTGFVLGLILLRKAGGNPVPENHGITCRRCHTDNALHARFCAKCGLGLGDHSTSDST